MCRSLGWPALRQATTDASPIHVAAESAYAGLVWGLESLQAVLGEPGSQAPLRTANTSSTGALRQVTSSHLDVGTCTRGLCLQVLLGGDVRIHQQARILWP